MQRIVGCFSVWLCASLLVENAGGATSADCLALMVEARRRTHGEFGVMLEREVVLVGELELAPL